jgi:hypothetical protein
VLSWSGLTQRFRALTLHEEFVRPVALAPAPRPKPIVLPPEELRPPARLLEAKLVDEHWMKHRPPPK